MAADSHDSHNSSIPERVDDVIAAYLESVDAGTALPLQDLFAQHADIADELKSFFDDCSQFEMMAKPLHLAQTMAGTPELAVRVPQMAASIESFPDRRFGDYELLEEIARGGMGVVYKARQISLNRIVALKMILAGRLASAEEVRRFRAEAEAVANLDHPGIVPIYEVGEQDGRHYFSMAYVPGQSLAERLREGRMETRESVALLKQICDAVHYAHQREVIHRDLKPANILLEEQGASSATSLPFTASSVESPPDTVATAVHSDEGSSDRILQLRPRVTDFGLAKRLHEDSELTGTGQILGTPNYMSPEQASSSKQMIGPATDVYSLGAIFYELLTGRLPFQAETPLDTLSQLLDSDPPPLRSIDREIPAELEAVCLKCLEKDPQHRYATAKDLGEELQRYLDGESIQASGVNLIDRMTRALRQSRHEEQFRDWGLGLIVCGMTIFGSHLAIFYLNRTWSESWAAYFLPRSVMFAILLFMLWRFRHYSVWPTKAAERLIWVVWGGYLLALASFNVSRLALGHDHTEVYSASAVLTGFGFLIMGGHVWGGGYVVGLVFMIAAPLLAIFPVYAPLIFGALWASALFTFGLHFWRRGRRASHSK